MLQVIPQLTASELQTIYAGKRVLIIGGTAGIGKALAGSLGKRGAKVTVVGRRSVTFPPESGSVSQVNKDLSLMKNAVALADEVGDVAQLDYVVFTNGIMAASTRQVSGEGVELDMAVSYLSRYVFLRRLVEKGFGKSNANPKQRVFVMGFPGVDNVATLDDFNSERNYSFFPVHMNTVVGNEALVTHYAATLGGKGVNVYGLNPGIIRTEIRDNYLGKGSWMSFFAETLIGWFTPSAEAYVERTLMHVIASPLLEDKTGTLINNARKVLSPNPFLTKDGNLDRVIDESAKLADRALNFSSSSQ